MKFNLQTERYTYTEKDKTVLEELGFKFEKYGDRWLIEWPKTAGLNLSEEELSAMKADPRTVRELIGLTGDTW